MTAQEQIKETVDGHDVVLFMNGTPQFPQDVSSATVAEALSQLGIPFTAINILDNEALREGIRNLSNSPIIPQLYVKSDFVGGYEIVCDMHYSGALEQLLRDKNILPQGDDV